MTKEVTAIDDDEKDICNIYIPGGKQDSIGRVAKGVIE